MFDDDYMNYMLLNPDLYGLEDEEDREEKETEDDEEQ